MCVDMCTQDRTFNWRAENVCLWFRVSVQVSRFRSVLIITLHKVAFVLLFEVLQKNGNVQEMQIDSYFTSVC